MAFFAALALFKLELSYSLLMLIWILNRWCYATPKTALRILLTWYFPFLLLVMRHYYYYALLVNSCCLLARSRSKPINISSVSFALGNSLYSNETICAWLISSIFFPLLVVNLDVLTKTPGPKLVNRTSIPSASLLSVAVCDTSKFKSR